MGADVVVAVDVSSSLRAPGRPENIRDVMACTLSIVASTNLGSRQEAEFLIRPKTEEFTRWDFGRIQEIIDAGRQAALPVVAEVLALLG
jgi:predicted acylesterase/phospholipase RssA